MKNKKYESLRVKHTSFHALPECTKKLLRQSREAGAQFSKVNYWAQLPLW